MRTYLFTLLFLLIPALSFSQSNTIEEFYEKLYLCTFKNEEHELKFSPDGVEMDGKLQYTGTRFFVMQGDNTILTATQTSNKSRETFTVNLDSGIVRLRAANMVLYAIKEDANLSQEPQEVQPSQEPQESQPAQEPQKPKQPTIEKPEKEQAQIDSKQDEDLAISLDMPIRLEEDHHEALSEPITLSEPAPVDKKNETSRYTDALTSCLKNLREMERIIAVYDTCGRRDLLDYYESLSKTNQSLLDDIDKSYVTYNQRLQKMESDYMSKWTQVQAKHDAAVNYLPEMIDADGFSFLVDTQKKELILYHPVDNSLSTYEVPSAVDYRIHTLKVVGIGTYAFENLTQLTEILLPPTITEIRHRAFAGCTNLKRIQLPDNLQYLGEETFLGCKSLQSITLPRSLATIEQLAFSKCTGLKEVVAEMPNPIQLGDDAFDTTKLNNALLILPNGSFEPYHNSSWASYFFNIKEQFTESIQTAHLLTESHTFLIKSDGTADFLSFPIKPYQDDFTVPEKIFNNSYTVTGIGDNAFYNQEGLKTVFMPATIEVIGDSAFAFCGNLTQVQLPTSLKSIGEKAFFVCKKLHSIALPDGLKTIKNSAFAFCNGLDSICFPNGLTSISDKVCQNCHQLKSISIPASVEVIGENAFQNCRELQTITLSNGTREIGKGAFAGCRGLIVVDLPQSISSLADNCFEGCDDIAAVYCHGQNPPQCADNAFSPQVIDAILYVPEKTDETYEMQGFKSKGFDKIKTLPNEEKLERHKAKSLADGLEDVSKKPRLREKRALKEARQK